MKKLTITLYSLVLFMLASVGASAQGTTNMIKGDKAYNEGNFYTAIKYYKMLYDEGEEAQVTGYSPYGVRRGAGQATDINTYAYAINKLAECYAKIYDYENAVKWYEKAVALREEGEAPVEVHYYYAEALQYTGDYALAEAQYRKYQQQASDSGAVTGNVVKKRIQSCEFGDEATRYPKPVMIDTLDSENISTKKASDYAMNFADERKDEFVFTSSRYREGFSNSSKKPYMNRIVWKDMNGEITPVRFNTENQYFNYGTPVFSMEGKRMYFTVWSTGPDSTFYRIYTSHQLEDSLWSDPVGLGDLVNTPNTRNRDPFVTQDGNTLYFSSDRASSMGGYDLYKVGLNAEGLPSSFADNLGPNVNSDEDDIAPFVDETLGKLFFASKGHIGLGGFDLFYSDIEGSNYTPATNMGAPLNSSYDDAYLVTSSIDHSQGYFSSDRTQGCCYDLFHFTKGFLVACGKIYDLGIQEPLEAVKVELKDSISNKVYASMMTDENGKYCFDDLDLNRDYVIVANKEGYIEGTEKFTTKGRSGNDSIPIPDLYLIPMNGDKGIVINNIYYDYDKSNLRAESKYTLDKLVREVKKHPEWVIEIGSHTDSKGSEKYNNDLSQRRSQSVVDYMISQGIDKDHIVAKGYGEGTPIVPNTYPNGKDHPENRQINRRTEFKILNQGKVIMNSQQDENS